MLLLLSRIAVAALLVAMLAGWTGSGGIANLIGGDTTHHVVIIDDSYSMGQIVDGGLRAIAGDNDSDPEPGTETTAYTRALGALSDLTRRIVSDDGVHQLTVIRTSRADLAIRGGGDSADAAADLAVQSVGTDDQLIGKVMSSSVSPISVSPAAALDLAVGLIERSPVDSTQLYIASDFRSSDWSSPESISLALENFRPQPMCG